MLTEMLVAYRLYGSGGGGGMPGGMPGGAPDGAGDDDGGAGPTIDEVKNAALSLSLSIYPFSLPPPRPPSSSPPTCSLFLSLTRGPVLMQVD